MSPTDQQSDQSTLTTDEPSHGQASGLPLAARPTPAFAVHTASASEQFLDPDPELEQEAEETAQRVMQGGELGIQRMSETDVHVQRLFGSNSEDNGSEAAQEEIEELSRQVAWLKENAVMKDELAGSGIDNDVSMEEMKQATINQHEANADGKGQQEGERFSWLRDQVPDKVSEAAGNMGRETATRGVATLGALGIAGVASGGAALPIAMAGTMAASKGIEQTITDDTPSADEIADELANQEPFAKKVAQYSRITDDEDTKF